MRTRPDAVLAALLLACWLPARLQALPQAGSVADERAADAETDSSADVDTATASSNSFFDTFMSFLGSSALHQQQPADEAEAAASEAQPQAAGESGVEQGRGFAGDPLSLEQLAAGPVPQDGGQADRVKRTGQLLSSALNHKLAYLHKGSHHIHFHNYNKCEKPHFSLWEFKKAILHKLLEAAKAIGGGVLALKGKLITAKGHLVAAKGRKLATKGEELTEFGKSVLAKALGHGGHETEVHSAPSAPSAPAAALTAGYPAPVYGAPAVAPAAPGYGYGYAAPQYLPPQPAPSGHGYNAAVSLLNEYSRAGFAPAAPSGPLPIPSSSHLHHTHHSRRAGMAPTGPSASATGPAGTLPGSLQAGLLVLQAAPAAPHRSSGNVAAASSYEHLAALPAPSGPSAPSGSASETMTVYSAQAGTSRLQPAQPAQSAQPLVLAPEYMNAVVSAAESNKVRRYAAPPSSRRSLDVAMAAVVRGLQGSDLLLRPDIVQSAATRLAHEAHGLASP